MKVCGACCNELSKDDFSKKQWQLKQYQRRCKECVGADRELQLKAPPTTKTNVIDDDDGQPTCWICLEEGNLRRDCSCRGGFGHAHLSCLARYAEQKHTDVNGDTDGEEFLQKLTEPWVKCPNCYQDYQNKLALDLASKCVEFMEESYDVDILICEWLKIDAYFVKLKATSHKSEAKRLAKYILSMIRRVKQKDAIQVSELLPFILHVEACVYGCLGNFNDNYHTKLKYFDRSRDIFKSLDHTAAVTATDVKIAAAKSLQTGTHVMSKQEQLKMQIKLYDDAVKHFGQDSVSTIQSGIQLGEIYMLMRREIPSCQLKSQRLLTKLYEISHRVHGPDHAVTNSVQEELSTVELRGVIMDCRSGERELFRLLEYKEDKCIIRGPITNDKSKRLGVFKVPPATALYTEGTPVVCNGLEDSQFNGKVAYVQTYDKDTKYYTIGFEDETLESCQAKADDFRVLFDLPNSGG